MADAVITAFDPVKIFEKATQSLGAAQPQAQREHLQNEFLDLEEEIRAIEVRLQELRASTVSKAQATEALAQSMRADLAAHREQMLKWAGAGAMARMRGPAGTRLSGLTGFDVIDLAVILLDDAAIQAFAADAIATTDAPDEARPEDEVAAEAAALSNRIAELRARRAQLLQG